MGRSIIGSTNKIRDILLHDKSILILGKPGSCKTTIIREIARIFSNELEKRVVIVDTSNEIAGDNDVPHVAVGRARRLQVKKFDLQHQVLIEAVENHMPEVIIIDEISTEYEGKAVVGKLDVDSNQEFAAKYGVRNIPTVLVFKNGELVDRQVGVAPKAKYAEALDSAI